MKHRHLFLLLSLLACTTLSAQPSIDLSGQWDFSMGDTPHYDDTITLPGSMLTNGKGHPVSVKTPWTGSLYDSSFYFNPYMAQYRQEGHMKFPFFLTPARHYIGRAWYRRTVQVPRSWRGQQVTLTLERPHIETTLLVNGHEVGHQMSLSVPHEYDVTPYLKYGRRNTLEIAVYNGIENVGVGQDSHSVTDQTQGNWNGIVGRIALRTTPRIYRLRVEPDIVNKRARILLNDTVYQVQLPADAALWDEFNPVLHTVSVSYRGHQVPVTFGLRQVGVSGPQLLINGRPVWMRGTVGNCCFPETGYPPTDEASWERVFGQCKAYGLNHIRFHSYCPPEAAFNVADRLGLYLQVEGPSWPNHGVKLRRGMVIDQYLMDEGRRMLDTYGRHPSFVMMAAGNEPAGDWVSYCRDWVKAMKQYDPTRIYCGASVGGGWAWDEGSEYHVKAGARGLDWDRHAPQSTDDYQQQLLFPRNYRDTVPNREPIIAHEQGQWCVFPDFKEIPQYTGAYQPGNLEIFRDLLRDNGMEQQAEKFLAASGHLQVLCYKYEMERNLRTPDYAGFQLLGLNDYSGQGTALVGPLNVHWREKGYCTAQDWTQFCNAVVPLARFPRFVFTDTDIQIPVDIYNAYKEPLRNARLHWHVDQLGTSGQQPLATLPLGRSAQVCTLQPVAGLQPLSEPRKLTLVVTVSSDNAPDYTNSWDFWLYPPQVQMPETDVYETDTLDQQALLTLQRGGSVLLTAAGRIRYGNDVRHTFLPVFWNTSWFKMRPPHTTGAYIQREHPVFRHFPTDDWQNLNWWELTNRAQVMNLASFPADYQPIVQPIDTWHVSRKLGMLLEARVLNGRLLMTTLDISHQLDSRPVARQLRYSVLRYMQSPDFQPTSTVGVDVIRQLFQQTAPPVNMFTNQSPDELKPHIGS